ncbi:MAG: phosphoribosylamine--glycine ligase, partial [Bacteroidota bacterium]
MNILLVGSGGREHALAWKMAQSPICKQLYIAPGNAGTSAFGQNVPIEVTDIEGLRQCCIDKDIHLV